MKNLQEKILENLKVLFIKNEEKHVLSELFICLFFTFLFCGLGWAIFDQSLKENNLTILQIISLLLMVFQGMFLVTRTTYTTNPGQEIKKGYLFILHLILPGKQERIKQAQFHLKTHTEQQSILESEMILNHQKFKQITKNNLAKWVNEHVRPEPSLTAFFEQRVTNNKSLPLTLDLIYWSQLIPRENIKLDHLKAILYTAQIIEPDLLIGMKTPSKTELSFTFTNYSSEDVFRIFTSPFKLEEYLYALKFSLDNKTPFILKKNIRELYLWTKGVERIKNNKFFHFKRSSVAFRIEGTCALGKIVSISNTIELEYWGIHLANCWKNYETRYSKSIIEITNGHHFLFGIYQNNKLVIGMKTNSEGLILEVKRKANGLVPDKEIAELQQYINKKLNIFT